MNEVLIAVMLYCQTHPGNGLSDSTEYALKLQKQCVKQLIRCFDERPAGEIISRTLMECVK